jgi:hypothetical protein
VDTLRVNNEPTAAAATCGLDKKATAGDTQLGGEDFDKIPERPVSVAEVAAYVFVKEPVLQPKANAKVAKAESRSTPGLAEEEFKGVAPAAKEKADVKTSEEGAFAINTEQLLAPVTEEAAVEADATSPLVKDELAAPAEGEAAQSGGGIAEFEGKDGAEAEVRAVPEAGVWKELEAARKEDSSEFCWQIAA